MHSHELFAHKVACRISAVKPAGERARLMGVRGMLGPWEAAGAGNAAGYCGSGGGLLPLLSVAAARLAAVDGAAWKGEGQKKPGGPALQGKLGMEGARGIGWVRWTEAAVLVADVGLGQAG
ncbi:hypothetical protein PLESTB_001730400 [Pleodorina starrii]|uniref:Uncharacterized protein n=1 Tax=Pleodorina starrii TaxID=330485 RepID=A0A9W6F9X9_9CHLO|nr:hypothetical protein PLESTB_001730400 [Pleodorina starrii]